ncbi:DUF2231 domain-containing protein [Phytomonospora sp. NPDC050363]|uniref:DUF2231 domain-containing protein n=1 Tax=Phytomonospora sp. NPDC050363 TaxID=3155642 RepID=UPI0033C0FDA9
MPTEFLGLPLHPLAVHLPVVFVPLLGLFAAAYALVPKVRRNIGWAVVALAVIAPVVAFAAKLSGQNLAGQRLEEMRESPEAAQAAATSFNDHSQYGDVLVWLVLALAIGALVHAGLASRRLDAFARTRKIGPAGSWLGADEPAGSTRGIVMIVLGAVLVILAVASCWYVFKAGHTGAEMLWG